MSEILRYVRIAPDINQTMLRATCLRHGCGWTLLFSTTIASVILDECEQHPCRPAPCTNCGHRDGV